MTIGEIISGAYACGMLLWSAAAYCKKTSWNTWGKIQFSAGILQVLLLIAAAVAQFGWLKWAFYILLTANVIFVLFLKFRKTPHK